MTRLVVLQPSYLPWLGYFDQLARADVFVCYDDVQYDKHGWRNRNRIKTAQGVQWLTVPVRHKGRFLQRNLDVEVDATTPWARKHVASLRQAYAHAPFLNDYLPALAEVLERPWSNLVDLNMAALGLVSRWLGVGTPVHRSSTLGVGGSRNERLIALCRHFGADRYLSGNAAKDYLDESLFAKAGIAVEWQNYDHPEYCQSHGSFVSHLSVIDLIFNAGVDALSIIRRGAGA